MMNRFLTDAQLQAELRKCESCEEKPCRTACPAHCSPADFIMAARVGERSDVRRAAAEILMNNPLGGVCGLVCPETHCKQACVHAGFSTPVEIPSVQATLVQRAKELDVLPQAEAMAASGHRVAVVGAGPAGLGAAAMLVRQGHEVEILDEAGAHGGAVRLIPAHRLPPEVLLTDIGWLLGLGPFRLQPGRRVEDPAALLAQGFDAVVVAAGLTRPIRLGVPGEEHAVAGLDYLADPAAYPMAGPVVVVGGGATAVDCAVTAKRAGAAHVELVALERWDEMPLTASERQELQEHGIEVTGRTRVTALVEEGGTLAGLAVEKVALPMGTKFNLADLASVSGTAAVRRDIRSVIVAIGARSSLPRPTDPRVVAAGDMRTGPTTVVSAVASGKNAALEVDALLRDRPRPEFPRHQKSQARVPGVPALPVPLATTFFGRTIRSPFLLSAAPPSDGYDQMRRAYEAGWAGGVMKTAFDDVPIHIPGAYMHRFSDDTYANSDNVSGHSLNRVCDEIRRLVKEFPDRLTIASTGGPVTGDDAADRAVWASNTRKLEASGAMAIEYSLSCPQGGDGTEGDIVSQSAALTAKIVDWIMEAGRPDVPKLFKLTGAVTSIVVIVRAIKEVLDRFPGKQAGITLANTFPTLSFRPGQKETWEEGIVVGMSGGGVAPISYLTLASAVPVGVPISGNGGPMDYKQAAHFLALGVETVQFCTVVLKYGYSVIGELESGLSHLMAERGIGSVAQLIGRAWPEPVTGFMELSPEKAISSVDRDLCQHCGNCARCPYLAIELDADRIPVMDPARCIGCGMCTLKCFSGALQLRTRTAEEAALLKED